MSQVLLLTADKPLPLCDCQELRSTTVRAHGTVHTVSVMGGFKVEEHGYYREAVDELGYPMRYYRYELQLERCEQDLQNLRDYLTENFSPGETVELWHIWVGDITQPRPTHYSGSLEHFDMATLAQLLDKDGCRMTITI